MPTYAYVCTACDHRFEIVQAITDASLTSCPECGGALRKVFHPVGVAFKGSGFYRTDSRTSEAKGKATSEVGAKSESASKDSADSANKSSTGDAKPASKSGASTPSGGSGGSSPSSGSSSSGSGSSGSGGGS